MFCELEFYEAAVGDLTQPAMTDGHRFHEAAI